MLLSHIFFLGPHKEQRTNVISLSASRLLSTEVFSSSKSSASKKIAFLSVYTPLSVSYQWTLRLIPYLRGVSHNTINTTVQTPPPYAHLHSVSQKGWTTVWKVTDDLNEMKLRPWHWISNTGIVDLWWVALLRNTSFPNVTSFVSLFVSCYLFLNLNPRGFCHLIKVIESGND